MRDHVATELHGARGIASRGASTPATGSLGSSGRRSLAHLRTFVRSLDVSRALAERQNACPRAFVRLVPGWVCLAMIAVPLAALASGCGGDDGSAAVTPDAGTDMNGCDPATVLPSNYRLIPSVSTGAVQVTTASGVTTGTVDATAGGLAAAADNPYIYVDLKAGTKVEVNDIDARTSTAWDVALKRSSLRANGGDSGKGGRQLAVVQAAELSVVKAAPASGFAADDFTTADCMLDAIPGGEPRSAFGEWYDYDVDTHAVTPKAEVYVIQRGDGSRTAFRIASYYGDSTMPMRGAFYAVEWKQLPAR